MMNLLMAASILVLGEAGHDTMAGRLDGRTLAVTVDGSGVTCRGYLVELAPDMGQGSLVCSDKRTGSFHWKLNDGIGSGYGRLGGESLVLTFG